MRRSLYAFVIAVMLFGCLSGQELPAFGASPTEMARMGTFISNFTEQGIYDIDIDTITHDELVHFGIWHNYINNFKSRIKRCPKKNCPYGSLIIDAKFVEESVNKYFDLDLAHDSAENVHYDGRVYHFDGADGETRYYADVTDVSRRGNIITMRGELYSAENEDDRPASFTATAKPYKFHGKNTWSILSLTTDWNN